MARCDFTRTCTGAWNDPRLQKRFRLHNSQRAPTEIVHGWHEERRLQLSGCQINAGEKQFSKSYENIFGNITASLRQAANVKNVFGEPVQANGKKLITVAKPAYGFGGGFGNGHRKREAGTFEKNPDAKADSEGAVVAVGYTQPPKVCTRLRQPEQALLRPILTATSWQEW